MLESCGPKNLIVDCSPSLSPIGDVIIVCCKVGSRTYLLEKLWAIAMVMAKLWRSHDISIFIFVSISISGGNGHCRERRSQL
ncbi:hypothetical protein TIFTF001_045743 [Ficus carica]|uniref:Uncharacterized protein n=1 Tax=Ficus carica TaxID=3494 RepID=A0AA87YVG2_FICCA|nr:hypothetical protein TIFTF001_045743 [Ficus carica]